MRNVFYPSPQDVLSKSDSQFFQIQLIDVSKGLGWWTGVKFEYDTSEPYPFIDLNVFPRQEVISEFEIAIHYAENKADCCGCLYLIGLPNHSQAGYWGKQER